MIYVTFRNGLICALLAGLSACGNGASQQEITDTAVRSDLRPPLATGVSSKERFAFALPERQPAMQAQLANDLEWHWSAPASWTELAPTQFRSANFTFGPNGQGECILTVMPNGGGGVMANVNRWYAQMELPPLTPSEFEALDRKTILGNDAVMLDIEGAFKGMGSTAQPGYRMLGALFELDGLGVFAKMTGPAAAVAEEKENFNAWLDSLHVARAGDHSHDHGSESAAGPVDSGAPLPADHPPIGPVSAGPVDPNAPLPADHPPIGAAGEAAPPFAVAQADTKSEGGRASGDGFSWDEPAGWQSESRPMRLVSYRLGEKGETECYITVLPSDAGGAVANINRWRAQMGQGPMTKEEIDALPKIDVLGTPTPLLEVSGTYTGMGGTEKANQKMLAIAAISSGNSVFIRMTGDVDDVAGHKDAFIAFCNSVRKD